DVRPRCEASQSPCSAAAWQRKHSARDQTDSHRPSRRRQSRARRKSLNLGLNKTVLPRAIAVNRWIVANSDQEAVRLLSDPEFDPARTAVVQNPEPSTKTVEQLASIPMRTDDSAALVTLVSYRSEKIVIQANTANDAVLLLSDTYYPGW